MFQRNRRMPEQWVYPLFRLRADGRSQLHAGTPPFSASPSPLLVPFTEHKICMNSVPRAQRTVTAGGRRIQEDSPRWPRTPAEASLLPPAHDVMRTETGHKVRSTGRAAINAHRLIATKNRREAGKSVLPICQPFLWQHRCYTEYGWKSAVLPVQTGPQAARSRGRRRCRNKKEARTQREPTCA